MSALRDRAGFTLIELLVVIAIIAIPIGLLLPAATDKDFLTCKTSDVAWLISLWRIPYRISEPPSA